MKRLLLAVTIGLLMTIAAPLAGVFIIGAIASALHHYGWIGVASLESAKMMPLLIDAWPLGFFSHLFPCCHNCECEISSGEAMAATLLFDLIAYMLLGYAILQWRAKLKLS